MGVEAAGLYLDLSKQSWSAEGFEAALDLARTCDVEGRRDALFGGEAVNNTEGRAVLHPALRAATAPTSRPWASRSSAEVDADPRRHGAPSPATSARAPRPAATKQPFTAIVHIGIGGSDLGPRLLWEALRPLEPTIELRFVANVDPRDMAEALAGLDPATTLVVVVSKTFTTQETLANAELARAWLAESLSPRRMVKHLSASPPRRTRPRPGAAAATFGFRDWVGGRYSLWSAVGLSCAVALGWDVFERVLAGAAGHGRAFPRGAAGDATRRCCWPWPRSSTATAWTARRGRSCPTPTACAGCPPSCSSWRWSSNGKRVKRDGSPVDTATGPVVFGDAGTNGQHAFFQLMHQGPHVVPVDFVAVGQRRTAPWTRARAMRRCGQRPRPGRGADGRQDRGRGARRADRGGRHREAEADRLAPHKTFPGDRPSTTILLDALTPEAVGALLALYEHKTFVEGVIWDINSFDQWGVELGKVLAKADPQGRRGRRALGRAGSVDGRADEAADGLTRKRRAPKRPPPSPVRPYSRGRTKRVRSPATVVAIVAVAGSAAAPLAVVPPEAAVAVVAAARIGPAFDVAGAVAVVAVP